MITTGVRYLVDFFGPKKGSFAHIHIYMHTLATHMVAYAHMHVCLIYIYIFSSPPKYNIVVTIPIQFALRIQGLESLVPNVPAKPKRRPM